MVPVLCVRYVTHAVCRHGSNRKSHFCVGAKSPRVRFPNTTNETSCQQHDLTSDAHVLNVHEPFNIDNNDDSYNNNNDSYDDNNDSNNREKNDIE